MTEFTSATGVTRDFSMSIERILELEANDPGFSLINDVRKLGHTYRLTYAEHILQAMGTTYRDFIADGFYLEDLGEIASKAMADIHFLRPSRTSSEDPGQGSS